MSKLSCCNIREGKFETYLKVSVANPLTFNTAKIIQILGFFKKYQQTPYFVLVLSIKILNTKIKMLRLDVF